MTTTSVSSQRIAPRLGTVLRQEIRSVRELTDEEYQDFKRNRVILTGYRSDRELIAVVEGNYSEYITAIDRLGAEYSSDQAMTESRMSRMMLESNRHLLNWLSSVRTFLDHSETALKRKHGDKSLRFEVFQAACSAAFDSSFAYRFLYKLRNYAQHCGLPVGILQANSRAEPSTVAVVHSLSVYFSRDELLSRFSGWGKVKPDLESQGVLFGINSLMSEAMTHLRVIDTARFSEVEHAELARSASSMLALVNEAIALNGGAAGVFHFNLKSDRSMDVSIDWFPIDAIEWIVKSLKEAVARVDPAP